MAEYSILKAREFSKQGAKFRKQYGDVNALERHGWWLQRKYDGCNAVVLMSEDRDVCMESRTGEIVRSCGHILSELREVMTPGTVILGEVWAPGLSFPTISGSFRRHKTDERLRLMAFDMLTLDAFVSGHSTAPYAERYSDLGTILPEDGSDWFARLAETWVNGWPDEATVLARQWQEAGGFDGAILRNPDSEWFRGDSKAGELIKIKPTMSLDLRCVNYGVTPGDKTGRMVVTLVVHYRGVETTVGSGVPHDLDPYTVAGKIIEVECLGVTEDGKLREPRFKGVRFDKLEPDA